ncbi:MAG: glyoxalase [Streptococcaceae bacterium]|nr:glyoxalase [Streptococcaceae bacterium]MCL2681797.1 glyoxalase [Streptococcaceae bacterium]MCL2858879.1 glyoxalase [Streptococcaceae bacterium]
MTFNMCTNLYVKDVNSIASIFKAIGLAELHREKVGESDTVILAPLVEGNARLQLWDIEFIRSTSPEVADDKPSLLFTVDNIEEIHEKAKNSGASVVSDIQEHMGKQSFYFATPEEQYFAFMQA